MEEEKEEKETYEEVKDAVDVPDPEDAEEQPEKPKAKAKANPKAKPKPEPAKPSKNDKVECLDCGKTMNANTLRYRHTCKPPKSQEIVKEKPRPKPQAGKENINPPESPRSKMVKYYREARVQQQDQKRAMYASWLGN